MKKIFMMFAIAAAFAACSNKTATEANEAAEVSVDSTGVNYTVDPATSLLNWSIDKKMIPGHNGSVMLSSGNVTVKDGTITAGGFVIDMNSIQVLDIPADNENNAKLLGHLKAADFFDVEKYPTSKFEITSAEVLSNDANGNTHNVSGNLTIKDSVHNITFPIKATVTGDEFAAEGQVVINRLKWGITYNSVSVSPADLLMKLGDNAIKDELTIKIALKAKK
jgi:polyisoprenoid-binding protein YceI